MMKKNRKILMIFGLLTLLLFGSTYAYFQASDSMDNKFRSMEAKVYINEKFDPNDEWVPGEEKQKEVRFGNEGRMKAVLRIKFTADEKVQLNFADGFDQNWTESGEWYYYNRVLAPEQLTDVTLKSVTISDAIGNTYEGTEMQVKVEGEFLQAAFAAEAANYMNWGMTPTINGDTVTWNRR